MKSDSPTTQLLRYRTSAAPLSPVPNLDLIARLVRIVGVYLCTQPSSVSDCEQRLKLSVYPGRTQLVRSRIGLRCDRTVLRSRRTAVSSRRRAHLFEYVNAANRRAATARYVPPEGSATDPGAKRKSARENEFVASIRSDSNVDVDSNPRKLTVSGWLKS